LYEDEVQTSFGVVKGTITSLQGRSIVSFRGIPYAKKITGENRFKDPLLPIPWTSKLFANKKVMCPQLERRFKLRQNDIPQSEDCLYLNIFFPITGINQKMPVLVYFHGGEFKYGSKDLYEPDSLLRAKDWVFVTVNYRLGALGFLSTGDNVAGGNYGLKDQLLALRWIQSQIENFRGDRNRITIFGHDAGAVSVDIFRVAPKSATLESLFNNAISVSGTVFSPWAIQYEPRNNSIELARRVKCSISSSEKMIACLRETPLNEILEKGHDLSFAPSVDQSNSKSLLRDDPKILYQNGDFTNVRHLFGLTESEGALDYFWRSEQIKSYNRTEKIRQLLQPYSRPYSNLNVIASIVHYNYFGRVNVPESEEEQRMIDVSFFYTLILYFK
ncbi:Venom carboxylesterase-6-like protein, partial [Dinothrombium tinctorium]